MTSTRSSSNLIVLSGDGENGKIEKSENNSRDSLRDVDEEKLRTLWCGSGSGSLDPRVDEEILYELFQNAGPLEKVIICSARNQTGKKFALIVFQHIESPAYAAELFKGTELFEKALILSTNSRIATGQRPGHFRSFSDPARLAPRSGWSTSGGTQQVDTFRVPAVPLNNNQAQEVSRYYRWQQTDKQSSRISDKGEQFNKREISNTGENKEKKEKKVTREDSDLRGRDDRHRSSYPSSRSRSHERFRERSDSSSERRERRENRDEVASSREHGSCSRSRTLFSIRNDRKHRSLERKEDRYESRRNEDRRGRSREVRKKKY